MGTISPSRYRIRQLLQSPAVTLVSLAFVLVGCAPIYGGPTGYTKSDPVWGTKYGYTDKLIGKDEHSVVVTGNPNTSRERVADIALLRAARLTIEHERTHFLILNQVSKELSAYEMISAPLGGLLVWFPISERETKEPRAVLLIRLLPTDVKLPANALGAAAVIDEVGARLKEGDMK
jgi:hypothetical protein